MFHYLADEQSCFPPLIGTLTILSALLVILCFAGSVYGCVSTCTTGEPLQVNFDYVLILLMHSDKRLVIQYEPERLSLQSIFKRPESFGHGWF